MPFTVTRSSTGHVHIAALDASGQQLDRLGFSGANTFNKDILKSIQRFYTTYEQPGDRPDEILRLLELNGKVHLDRHDIVLDEISKL